MLKVISLLLLSITISACSNQQMYDAIQAGNRNECDKYNDDATVRQKCIEDASKSYDEYKRESGIESEKQSY